MACGSRIAFAAHRGQLERDDDATAGIAGLSLRWRNPDAFHPYVLAGAGFLDSDRMFGAVGCGPRPAGRVAVDGRR